MGSLNSRQLELARCICIARDGRNCPKCNKYFHNLENVVHVDHIDGNPQNNPDDGSNWQLLCHSCNVQKWHRQKWESVLDTGNPDESITLRIGSKMEFRYIRWLYAVIKKSEKKRISYDSAINTGALEIEGSPETTKRYLRKHIQDSSHHKAIFRKVFIDFDTFIKLSKQAEDDNAEWA